MDIFPCKSMNFYRCPRISLDLRDTDRFPWFCICVNGHHLTYVNITGFQSVSWISMDVNGFHRMFKHFHVCQQTSPEVHVFPWTSVDFHEHELPCIRNYAKNRTEHKKLHPASRILAMHRIRSAKIYVKYMQKWSCAPYTLRHRISSICYRIRSHRAPYTLRSAPYTLKPLPYTLRHCTV